MSEQDTRSHSIDNRSMPPGIIIPVLIYPDMATAVVWLCTTFGFSERLRIGNHRTQLRVEQGAAMVVAQATREGTASPTNGNESSPNELTHSIMVRVADVDRHYAHTQQCGAQIIQPPTDYSYGERQYTVIDLASHHWTFTQSIADVDPLDWGGILT